MEHDTSNYKLSAPHGCCAHLCALCRETIALDPGVYTAAQIDQRIADHHAICPKRPIHVGDYVRWEYGPAGHFAMPTNWVEGEVMRADRYVADIRADRCGMGHRVGKVNEFGISAECGSTIRRIPRPAEAQAAVPVFPAGADRSQPCPTCSKGWGEHYGIACSYFDRRRPCGACGDPLGDHLKTAGCHGPAPVIAVPPATALVDGIDREQCLARWMENRLAVEGGAPPHAMTRMQRDVGRALWLERFGAERAAELRAKIAAGREAERNRVRVEVQDVD